MKKATGYFFVFTALFIIGSVFKPLAEEHPRLYNIEFPNLKVSENYSVQDSEVETNLSNSMPRLT